MDLLPLNGKVKGDHIMRFVLLSSKVTNKTYFTKLGSGPILSSINTPVWVTKIADKLPILVEKNEVNKNA